MAYKYTFGQNFLDTVLRIQDRNQKAGQFDRELAQRTKQQGLLRIFNNRKAETDQFEAETDRTHKEWLREQEETRLDTGEQPVFETSDGQIFGYDENGNVDFSKALFTPPKKSGNKVEPKLKSKSTDYNYKFQKLDAQNKQDYQSNKQRLLRKWHEKVDLGGNEGGGTRSVDKLFEYVKEIGDEYVKNKNNLNREKDYYNDKLLTDAEDYDKESGRDIKSILENSQLKERVKKVGPEQAINEFEQMNPNLTDAEIRFIRDYYGITSG
tara:strand:+ start:135 stop:935 length:801 start_codon:yes stop_codon:yes gene_type:complete